jgi:hypothetical protein
MRRAIFLAVIAFAAQRSTASAIEAQFGSGYEGVRQLQFNKYGRSSGHLQTAARRQNRH